MNNTFWKIFLLPVLFAMACLPQAEAKKKKPAEDKISMTFAEIASVELKEVVFAVRKDVVAGHWFGNFGYSSTKPEDLLSKDGGKLCRLNLTTKELTLLIDDARGTVRDPNVHYDGQKILFSYRPGGDTAFHLFEINIDGKNLRQLTFGEYSDIEPIYLPDGDIIFISSRAKRWVPCATRQVAILYRCDGDGKNIRALSSNIEFDNNPWMMPDGRVMYTRWEYVDRSQMDFSHLWVMNPDGTKQTVLYGNMHPGDVYLDPKPVPGQPHLLVIGNSPGHGKDEGRGRISLLDLRFGPDKKSSQKMINKKVIYHENYPLSANEIMVATSNSIVMMDSTGATSPLYTLPAEHSGDGMKIREPRPLRSRPREPIIPSAIDLSKKTGQLILMDTYLGRNMGGIKRGTIKKLLLLENLPKPWNNAGYPEMQPLTWGGSFALTRVLGTVPVEPDGSANMEVPANRSIFFVALDENDMSVKRMCSFLTVMPGEVNSCIGCHEDRTEAIPNMSAALAARRPPSKITPIPGTPEIFDFPRDIQPVLDKYCVSCHNADKYAGRVLLTGDHGPSFTHSYYTLASRLQMADGRNLASGNYPPYSIGSAGSPLLDKFDRTHCKVSVDPKDLRLIKLWIDASATFSGTYACINSGTVKTLWKETSAAKEVMDRRCVSCHKGDMRLPSSHANFVSRNTPGGPPYGEGINYNKKFNHLWTPPWVKPYGDGSLRVGSREWMKKYAHPQLLYGAHVIYNLSYPEKSVQLMAPLSKDAGGYGICGDVFKNKDDPDYKIMLKAIVRAKQELESITRFTMPNFKPNPHYVRELKRYGILDKSFQIGDPIDVYKLEQKYWEQFWYQPSQE